VNVQVANESLRCRSPTTQVATVRLAVLFARRPSKYPPGPRQWSSDHSSASPTQSKQRSEKNQYPQGLGKPACRQTQTATNNSEILRTRAQWVPPGAQVSRGCMRKVFVGEYCGASRISSPKLVNQRRAEPCYPEK
jgi:hypothetical protein